MVDHNWEHTCRTRQLFAVIPSDLYDEVFQAHVSAIVKRKPWIKGKGNMNQTLKVLVELGLEKIKSWPDATFETAGGEQQSMQLKEHMRIIGLIQDQLEEMNKDTAQEENND